MATPEICPQCGEDVPPGARACPHCGADEETGWSDEATLDRLGLPSQDFDYQSFIEEEFPSKSPKISPTRPRGISLWWWLVAILLLLMFFKFRFFQ